LGLFRLIIVIFSGDKSGFPKELGFPAPSTATPLPSHPPSIYLLDRLKKLQPIIEGTLFGDRGYYRETALKGYMPVGIACKGGRTTSVIAAS